MNTPAKVHVFYVIAILVAANIVSLTVELGALPDVVSYINFAATLASLILAILAIVYNYVSSGSLAAQSGQVTEATAEMKRARESISAATNKLESLASTLPDSLKGIRDKVDKMHGFWEKLANNASTRSASRKQQDAEAPIQPRVVAFNSSPLGQLAMLIACLSKDSGKRFKFGEIAKRVKCDRSYIHGWLMAMDASNLFDIESDDNEYWTTDMPEGFTQAVEDAIEFRLSKSTDPDLADAVSQMRASVRAIKDYFRE